MRLKHTAKLERLLKEGVPYEEILKQSKKVDKFIAQEMKFNSLKKWIPKRVNLKNNRQKYWQIGKKTVKYTCIRKTKEKSF